MESVQAGAGGVPERALFPSIGVVTVAVADEVAAESVRRTLLTQGCRQRVRITIGLDDLPESGPTVVAGRLTEALDYDDLAVRGRDFLPAPYEPRDLIDRIRVAAVRSVDDDLYATGDYHRVVQEIADRLKTAVLFFDTSGRPRLRNRMVRRVLALAGYDPTTGLAEHVYSSDRVTRVEHGRGLLTAALAGIDRGVIHWIGDPQHPAEQRAIITEAHRIRNRTGAELGTAMMVYDVTDVATLIGERADYLAAISHELRTPLTGALGFLELIAENDDFATWGVESEFTIVQRNLDQLAALVRRLSGIGLRRDALRLAPVDLATLVERAAETARSDAGRAGVEIGTRLAEPCLPGRADEVRLRQALDNLLSNAVKYTPEGGTVTLTLERDGDDAVIAVADTGIGIEPRELDKVFERFYRTPALRGSHLSGHGIGLAVVKAVAEAHGGTATVRSIPGQGSTFTLRLPLRPPGSALADIDDD